ncbi:hypothetical protein BCV72DRAFT_326047 [Rhizopus microsporus var. microsporus]|uniref:Uncharacterized protein n=1 Tax=Rhizopus microsporus var. microsporus TaxID=86635 RepID=A0A1X0QLT5_RHIZD|nr:hypothetical protein BCV72DRAFT_326047 [Rhizopus microsporus var. microsporus]
MNPTTAFDFGPTQQPVQQSSMLTMDQPLDFGLPASVPDWFRPFQARLLHVESLVQENQRLREELNTAQARIAELEASQTQQPQQPQQPKLHVGTEASKWKSTSATPTAKPNPPPQPATIPAPYKAAALKGKKTAPPAPKPSTTRPRKVLSTRQLQVVARTFTPVSGTHGYQYIYLPCRFREPITSARGKLAKLRLENSRILHLYYPTSRVVAILVHNDYVEYTLTTLKKAGIKPLEEFNPRDATHLRDSKFADLTNHERHLKMYEIHTASLLRALDRVRVEVRPSVARSFLNKSWITQEQYQGLLSKSRPPRQASTKVNASFLDVTMDEVPPQDSIPPTQDQPSPTGAGEPAEELL